MNSQAAIPNISSFQDYERSLAPFFEENIDLSSDLGAYCGDVVPYLEQQELSRQKIEEIYDAVNPRIARCAGCGKFFMEGHGSKTGKLGVKRLTCKKLYCRECGEKDGRVHQKRLLDMLEDWGPLTEKSRCGHWVMTIPEEDQYLFVDRTGVRKYQNLGRKCMKKEHPHRGVHQALHAVGDKGGNKLHLHLHTVTKLEYGERYKKTPEEIAAFKERYEKGMRKLGCQHEGSFDVFYNWGRGAGSVYNKLKYLSQPRPGGEVLDAMVANPELVEFVVVTMERQKWIRSYGWPKKEKKKADEDGYELSGNNKLAGEVMIWDWEKILSQAEVDALRKTYAVLVDTYDFIKFDWP